MPLSILELVLVCDTFHSFFHFNKFFYFLLRGVTFAVFNQHPLLPLSRSVFAEQAPLMQPESIPATPPSLLTHAINAHTHQLIHLSIPVCAFDATVINPFSDVPSLFAAARHASEYPQRVEYTPPHLC